MLAEAVELATAWVQHVARKRGIRMLLIKGDSLRHHGLRAARVSADVDVLVDPTRFEDFCAAVSAAGWHERGVPLIGHYTSPHSRAFLRDGWPCDIDVHRFFPGFLAEPSAVFDALWARRTSLRFGHTSVEAADRSSSILILALHSLRDGNVSNRHRQELDALMRLELTSEEKRDLADLAVETGSAATLSEILSTLKVDVTPSIEEVESQELGEWRGRVASKSSGAYAWGVALRKATWRKRALFIWRAIWPSDRDLLLSHPEAGGSQSANLRARSARLLRGIQGIPSAVRAHRVRARGKD